VCTAKKKTNPASFFFFIIIIKIKLKSSSSSLKKGNGNPRNPCGSCTPQNHSRCTECNIQDTIYNKTLYTINRLLLLFFSFFFFFIARSVNKFFSVHTGGVFALLSCVFASWSLSVSVLCHFLPLPPVRGSLFFDLFFFFVNFQLFKIFFFLKHFFFSLLFFKSIYNCWFCAENEN